MIRTISTSRRILLVTTIILRRLSTRYLFLTREGSFLPSIHETHLFLYLTFFSSHETEADPPGREIDSPPR